MGSALRVGVVEVAFHPRLPGGGSCVPPDRQQASSAIEAFGSEPALSHPQQSVASLKQHTHPTAEPEANRSAARAADRESRVSLAGGLPSWSGGAIRDGPSGHTTLQRL